MAKVNIGICYSEQEGYKNTGSSIELTSGEAMIISKALKYYTDKRKLDFKERMAAGTIAEEIDRAYSKAMEDAYQSGRRPKETEQ